MKAIISSSKIEGELIVPSSKSHFQRLLAASFLAEGTSELFFQGTSDDVESLIEIIQSIARKLIRESDRIIISGGWNNREVASISFGESGLAARLFLPILAIGTNEIHLQAKGSLLHRSQIGIIDALFQMGVSSKDYSGRFPFSIQGPLRAGNYRIDAGESSQFLSGVLFSLPILKNDSQIFSDRIISSPYLDLSLEVLSAFGIKIKRPSFHSFLISGNQEYKAGNHKVEGDWSSAAALLVAAQTAGKIGLKGLNIESKQADRKILEILKHYRQDEDILQLERCADFKAFELDLSDTPDLFPVLASLAALTPGTSRLHGAHRLINKESNRRDALVSEFSKLNIKIEISEDTLIIDGGNIRGGKVWSHGDHRMAMALAILGLSSGEIVEIEAAESISKSYPGFWGDLIKLGARIHLIN